MPAKNVDIVFVIDASDSMAPCFPNVVNNIEHMLSQLRQASFNVRLDAVISNVPSVKCYRTESVLNEGSLISNLYHPTQSTQFFTSDIKRFCRYLKNVEVEGDEDMLLALDLALDFPFGPIATTQRVVVLLSDEPFDTNYQYKKNRHADKLDDMIDKIHTRKITLFMAMPGSETANTLAEADKSDFIPIATSDDGLKDFDFKRFFSQLGKTISVSSRQITKEGSFKKALYGQDDWGKSSGKEKKIGDTK